MVGCKVTAKEQYAQGIAMDTVAAIQKPAVVIASTVGPVKDVANKRAAILTAAVMVNAQTARVFVLMGGTVCHVKADRLIKQAPTIARNCIIVTNMVNVMRQVINVYAR
jgi:hypothetical protein